MSNLVRVTIFVLHNESSADFEWVENWLAKWKGKARVVDYSTGGWEHLWDIEAPIEATQEIPTDWLCASEWATPEIFNKP